MKYIRIVIFFFAFLLVKKSHGLTGDTLKSEIRDSKFYVSCSSSINFSNFDFYYYQGEYYWYKTSMQGTSMTFTTNMNNTSLAFPTLELGYISKGILNFNVDFNYYAFSLTSQSLPGHYYTSYNIYGSGPTGGNVVIGSVNSDTTFKFIEKAELKYLSHSMGLGVNIPMRKNTLLITLNFGKLKPISSKFETFIENGNYDVEMYKYKFIDFENLRYNRLLKLKANYLIRLNETFLLNTGIHYGMKVTKGEELPELKTNSPIQRQYDLQKWKMLSLSIGISAGF